MYKKLMVVLFAGFLLVSAVLSLVLMPKEKYPFSQNENRYLASLPELSFESYKDKQFMSGFDEWTSDMFYEREKWITLKNKTERLVGKTEINGVFTYGGRMMQVWNTFDEALRDKNLDAVEQFALRHEAVPVYFLMIPTAQEIYQDLLPKSAVIGNQSQFIADCYHAVPSVTGISITEQLLDKKDDYIFYRTDHHWTSLGAYYAYTALGEQLGFTPYPLDRFTVEQASDSFQGTLFSKTLDQGVSPDTIDYYHLQPEEIPLTLQILGTDGNSEYTDLYFRDFLAVKDKYSSFLGQNSPIMKITTNGDNEQKLLIFKDSYAHCLIPFLARHYAQIDICDMRYINVDYGQFVDVDAYDEVLFIYNVITFSEDNNLWKLNLGGSTAGDTP